MMDWLNDIVMQLRHFTHEEIVALLQSFLAELDAPQQQRFHAPVAQGPRPLAAEAMGLEDAEGLLASIRELHDAIWTNWIRWTAPEQRRSKETGWSSR